MQDQFCKQTESATLQEMLRADIEGVLTAPGATISFS